MGVRGTDCSTTGSLSLRRLTEPPLVGTFVGLLYVCIACVLDGRVVRDRTRAGAARAAAGLPFSEGLHLEAAVGVGRRSSGGRGSGRRRRPAQRGSSALGDGHGSVVGDAHGGPAGGRPTLLATARQQLALLRGGSSSGSVVASLVRVVRPRQRDRTLGFGRVVGHAEVLPRLLRVEAELGGEGLDDLVREALAVHMHALLERRHAALRRARREGVEHGRRRACPGTARRERREAGAGAGVCGRRAERLGTKGRARTARPVFDLPGGEGGEGGRVR